MNCFNEDNPEKAKEIFEANREVIPFNEYDALEVRYTAKINLIRKEARESIDAKLESYNFEGADSIFRKFEQYLDKEAYLTKKVLYQYIHYFTTNFKDDKKSFSLDLQQAAAIIEDAKNILVSARAGSGKTRVIVAKILSLLEKECLPWDSLCVLAFNRNVPKEISDRINNKISLCINPEKYSQLDVSQTFHKLARSISNYKGKILAEDKKMFIKGVITYLKEARPDFKYRVYEFFRTESTSIEKKQFKDPESYYSFIRNSKYRTLKGETVKSVGEKWIADFLYEHGIDYYYEKSFYPSYITSNIKDENLKYRIDSFISDHKETKPDFYLIKEKIVWEHWGIDENENNRTVRKEFNEIFKNTTWDEYKETLEWKRKFWSQRWRKSYLNSNHWAVKDIYGVHKLIETSIADLKNCDREEFEYKLATILKSENIKVEKRNKEDLIKDVWLKAIDRFTMLIESFINRYQQRYFDSKEVFLAKMEAYEHKSRVYEFLKLGIEILEEYEKQLCLNTKDLQLKQYTLYTIDFNQLVLSAIKRLDNGEVDEEVLRLRWILIDEYQDFSELFYRLINSIRSRNNSVKIFCVGDDWQSINRFAGSDVSYFNNYSEYFKESKVVNVSTNYRSNENIISCSNTFMLNNGFVGPGAIPYKAPIDNSIIIQDADDVFIQLNDESIDYKEDYTFISQFENNGKRENNYFIKAKYLKKCYEIIKDNPNSDILILHRNNEFKYSVSLDEFSNKLCSVLTSKKDYSKEEFRKRISIRTIHASKGLEADIVILLEIINGVIPMYHSDNELFEIFGESIEINMEDQKRLFYVALTRAKEKLYILTEKENRSDFLDEFTSTSI